MCITSIRAANRKDFNARAFEMSVKSLLGAMAAVGSLMLTAGAANASIATYTTSSAYLAAFTSDPNLTNAVSDPVDWGAFADSLHTARDNGTVPNNSTMTTTGAHGGETIKVSSGNNSTFTTYLNAQTGHWKGNFLNNTNVLFTAGT